jgi:hypothetical protein
MFCCDDNAFKFENKKKICENNEISMIHTLIKKQIDNQFLHNRSQYKTDIYVL